MTGLPIQPVPGGESSGDPSEGAFSFGPDNTPYDALGGNEGVQRLVETFYDMMDCDDRFAGIRSLHKPDLSDATGKLYEFLSGWLGGPQLYVEKYGHPKLRGRHMPFPIGVNERDLWMMCMTDAMNACEVEGEIRSFLDARFAHVANFMRNQEE